VNQPVVVTGLGIVSCLGDTYPAVVDSLRRGSSGVRAAQGWQELGLKSLVAGALGDVESRKTNAGIPKKILPALSDAALYCALAARDAVADAGLTAAEISTGDFGCFVGSGTGSVTSIYHSGALLYQQKSRRIDPYVCLRSMSSCCSAVVANLLDISGRSYSISSACATSAHNIGHAYELIRAGQLEAAVAGGGQDVNELVSAAFQALRLALSTRHNATPERASRPYDAARDGFVLSGGGGIVVLESLARARARGARIHAEILGFGANSDAFDLVLPDPSGRQAADCIRRALDDARIAPEAVDYVNTHGTSTPAGDPAEIEALRQVFGDRMPPFSSTKSMTGHALAAAGAQELIYCMGMLENGFIAPSINVENLDPAFEDLPVVTATRERELGTVISNSFGFGGTNAVLVLGRHRA